jgi:hypothetical protein
MWEKPIGYGPTNLCEGKINREDKILNGQEWQHTFQDLWWIWFLTLAILDGDNFQCKECHANNWWIRIIANLVSKCRGMGWLQQLCSDVDWHKHI